MTDIALPNERPLSFSLIIENVPERWKKNVFPITLQNATMEKMSISSISTDGTTFRTVKKNATWRLVFEVKNVGFCITWSMAASCYIFYQVAAAHSKKKEAHHHLRRLPFSQDHVFPSTLCLHSTNLPFAHLYYTMACLMGWARAFTIFYEPWESMGHSLQLLHFSSPITDSTAPRVQWASFGTKNVDGEQEKFQ